MSLSQVDLYAKEPKQMQLYSELEKLVSDHQESVKYVRLSEKEVWYNSNDHHPLYPPIP